MQNLLSPNFLNTQTLPLPETTYRKYTTGLKLQLSADTLEKEQYKLIPKSDRARWKKQDAGKAKA